MLPSLSVIRPIGRPDSSARGLLRPARTCDRDEHAESARDRPPCPIRSPRTCAIALCRPTGPLQPRSKNAPFRRDGRTPAGSSLTADRTRAAFSPHCSTRSGRIAKGCSQGHGHCTRGAMTVCSGRVPWQARHAASESRSPRRKTHSSAHHSISSRRISASPRPGYRPEEFVTL